MDYKNVLFEIENNIALITINRPKVLNAINLETLLELENIINKCKDEVSIKVAILTGAGEKAFVAGADITEFKDKSPKQAMYFLEKAHSVCRSMEIISKPFIAAVNGLALGGGTEISLACDIRFASDKAVFGQPEVLLGLIPGWGGTQRLSRLVGMGRAKELIMSGEQITAQHAQQVGLVNKIFPTVELMEKTKEFANKLAERPPFAIEMIKYAINNGYDLPLENALKLEILCNSMCFSTKDLREGVTAFLEKREAKFTGR